MSWEISMRHDVAITKVTQQESLKYPHETELTSAELLSHQADALAFVGLSAYTGPTGIQCRRHWSELSYHWP